MKRMIVLLTAFLILFGAMPVAADRQTDRRTLRAREVICIQCKKNGHILWAHMGTKTIAEFRCQLYPQGFSRRSNCPEDMVKMVLHPGLNGLIEAELGHCLNIRTKCPNQFLVTEYRCTK